jgi:hypothetical protein
MRKLSYLIERTTVMAAHDAVILLDGDDLQEALGEAVLQFLGTEIELEIGGQKMHLAGWLDPEHWSEDWEAKLGPDDDIAGKVWDLLAGAVEEGS